MFKPDASVKRCFTSMSDYHAARNEFLERNLNIMHLIVSAAEYATIMGSEPDAAIGDPGGCPEAIGNGATAEARQIAVLAFDRWKVLKTMKNEQILQLTAAKNDLLEIMPIEVKESMKVVNGATTVGFLNKSVSSLLEDCDALYKVATKQTLDKVRSELPRKCSGDPKDMKEVSVQYRRAFQLFATANQPIPQYDQFRMFSDTLPSSFELFLKFFDMKHPDVADVTFELLVKEALEESEKQATTAVNVANAVTYSGTAPATTTTSAPLKYKSYCWSHGNVISANHTSVTCKDKHRNHDDTATMDNKHLKGGKLTDWVPRKPGQQTGP